ncbi:MULTISPECIES: DUF2637 domain-containing protein [Nocardia]|uniref:DUF2637 domain-containing protein n=1 Tax=Nocardia TaxID=1817 RepID=UPI0007A40DCF|nr:MULTISPECIES: DUF2637 domain-containing protein [Nocardia]MCC3311445.1 DUF2637 domain-containing protein [Nocardia africana]
MPAPDTTVRTPPPSSAPEHGDRPDRAHAFFWCVLVASATVSITGNAVHAVLHAPAPPIAGAVAVVPPIALLTAVHGVTVLQRKQVHSTAAHRLTVVLTVLIAAGAFWLSFTALRSLAELAGIPHNQAWLWPLIIEGSMTQATVALISITQPPHNTSTPTEDAAPTTPTMPATPPDPSPALADDTVRTSAEGLDGRVESAPSTTQWSDIAAAICARDPAGRRNADQVAQVLELHYSEGLNATEIAKRTRRSRSTVSRILTHTKALDLPPVTMYDRKQSDLQP